MSSSAAFLASATRSDAAALASVTRSDAAALASVTRSVAVVRASDIRSPAAVLASDIRSEAVDVASLIRSFARSRLVISRAYRTPGWPQPLLHTPGAMADEPARCGFSFPAPVRGSLHLAFTCGKENATASRISIVVCPSCRSQSRVLESRRAPDGDSVRRRRECPSCGRRFTTFERREPEPAYVIKRDGERQRFDRTKLRGALTAAAHKRPITAVDVEAIVDRIEMAASDSGALATERIGELCLADLEMLDHGAYLQFLGTLPPP